ncbi:hypothetical protein [Marinithermus hydrothermalis]|uniref:Uncharacterized protein n=1 Tax=Marinithermus hydrothermalis (strain DSM 14884 / JCM 11576 / T1) TaxID=869210 RepID=F2NM54_MARHT|nr:hypothetical protein [Marinithermus hydrothermalis]AEB11524.1 hypothetical protein Marky_0774 [Marinithermus hydrothermalis DSM 14884]
MQRFSFPWTRVERGAGVLAVVAVGVLQGGLTWRLVRLAHAANLTFPELLNTVPEVRVPYALSWFAAFAVVYAVWAGAATRSRTVLEVGEAGLRFVRPGLPVLGLGAREVRLEPGAVTRLVLEDYGMRARFWLEAEGVRFAVPLEAGVAEGGSEGTRGGRDWERHPLVQLVVARTGGRLEVKRR